MKDDNSGAAMLEELKEGFLKVINTLSGKQVFDKEAMKKLAIIDSMLSWHENFPTSVITKMDTIRNNKALWKSSTKNITIPQHVNILVITQALKDYKAHVAHTQQVPVVKNASMDPSTQLPQQ